MYRCKAGIGRQHAVKVLQADARKEVRLRKIAGYCS